MRNNYNIRVNYKVKGFLEICQKNFSPFYSLPLTGCRPKHADCNCKPSNRSFEPLFYNPLIVY